MLILNERQQKFVDLAVDWFYNSPSKLLQLAGYAGTGYAQKFRWVQHTTEGSLCQIKPEEYLSGQIRIYLSERRFI